MKLNYMLAYYRVLSRFFNQVGHETRMHLVEINNVNLRIMNRADKNWAHF